MTTARKRLKPRKQPTQRRASETVSVILEASAHILRRQGASALTTNTIAMRAGVSIGSLYQYFPNKDAIVARLVIEQTEAFEQQVLGLLGTAASLPLEAGLRHVIGGVLDHHARHRDLERALVAEERRLPLDSELRQSQSRIMAALEAFLRVRPELEHLDIPLAASTLVIVVRALADAAVEADADAQTMLQDNMLRVVRNYLLRGSRDD